MATLSRLAVEITGNTVKLQRSLERAQTLTQKFAHSASQALRRFGLVAAGAIAGFAALSIKEFASFGDEVHKMALRTGFSTEALSKLRFAAEQSGTSLEGIEKAVRTMAGAIFDAEQGLTTYVRAFDALGLSADDLSKLSPEKQFLAIAGAIGDVDHASTRAALAADIFGRAGTQLLPLISQGSEGLAAYSAEAERLAIVLSQKDADAAADFTDAMDKLRKSVSGLQISIGRQLAPVLTGMINAIAFLPQPIKIAGAATLGLVGAGALLIVSLGVIIRNLQIVASLQIKDALLSLRSAAARAVQTAATWASSAAALAWTASLSVATIATIAATAATAAFGIALAVATSPITLITIAVAALVAGIVLLVRNWDAVWDGIRTTFQRATRFILDLYKSAWGWLMPFGPMVKAILFLVGIWAKAWRFMTGGFASAAKNTQKTAEGNSFSWLRTGMALSLGVLTGDFNRFGTEIAKAWTGSAGDVKETYENTIKAGVIDKAIEDSGNAVSPWTTNWENVTKAYSKEGRKLSKAYITFIGGNTAFLGDGKTTGTMVQALLELEGTWQTNWAKAHKAFTSAAVDFDNTATDIKKSITGIGDEITTVSRAIDQFEQREIRPPRIPGPDEIQSGGVERGGSGPGGTPDPAEVQQGIGVSSGAGQGSGGRGPTGGGGGRGRPIGGPAELNININNPTIRNPFDMEQSIRQAIRKAQVEGLL